MTRKKDIGDFLDVLNKEDAQEREIEAHKGSFFATAPDASTMVARAREFDDIHKHWVRRDLWLKTVRRIKNAKGAGLRLLTLPGQHFFEIKLYAKEGLLERQSHDGEELQTVTASVSGSWPLQSLSSSKSCMVMSSQL